MGGKRNFFRNVFRGSNDSEHLVTLPEFSEEENSREITVCENKPFNWNKNWGLVH